MEIIIVIVTIILAIPCLGFLWDKISDIKERKQQQKQREKEKRKYNDEYVKMWGCTPTEMAIKINTSPNIHKIAQEIIKRRPRKCIIKHDHIFCYGPGDKNEVIKFNILGVNNIPGDCVAVLAKALATDPLLNEYSYFKNCSDYGDEYGVCNKEPAEKWNW